MDPAPDEQRDLQAAADELGVHYQTAYRWVRSGRLPAVKVGGRYLVRPSDIAELDRLRRTPRTPPAPRPARLARVADRMFEALVAGDEPTADELARRLVDEGAPILTVLQDVLVPAMRRIGDGWEAGEVPVWVEHRASAIVERLLGELTPRRRGRRRGVAVVVAVTGERHSLPTTMAAFALRGDNWVVHHLGADLPPDQIEQFCAEQEPSLAVITVTTSSARRLADRTAAALRAAGTPTIVGHPGDTLTDLVESARHIEPMPE